MISWKKELLKLLHALRDWWDNTPPTSDQSDSPRVGSSKLARSAASALAGSDDRCSWRENIGADSKIALPATSACRMEFNSMCYARGRKHRMNSPGGKPSMNAPCAIHVVTAAPRKDGGK